MSAQRFTPEFKEDAVKQVRDRGYGVTEVAARLGVSAHSLYKWVKAVSSDKSEQQSKERKRCFDLTFNGGGMRLIFRGRGASAYDDVR